MPINVFDDSEQKVEFKATIQGCRNDFLHGGGGGGGANSNFFCLSRHSLKFRVAHQKM